MEVLEPRLGLMQLLLKSRCLRVEMDKNSSAVQALEPVPVSVTERHFVLLCNDFTLLRDKVWDSLAHHYFLTV